MEKRFAGLMVGILLVVFSFGTAVGASHIKSIYTMLTYSNILVLPVDGEQTEFPVMVVNSSNYAIAPGTVVNCLFQELWEGELDTFGVTQSINVGEDGYARIPVPSSSEAKFRYATLWVEGQLASVEHKMFWYTDDLSMPAKIVPVDVSPELILGETRDFVYQIRNAWGDPLPNVQVSAVLGNEYITSPQTAVTDSFGEVIFEVTAPSGTVGNTELRVQVEPLSFIQAAMMVAWDYSIPTPTPTPTPPPTPTGEVATISAVNATSYDGSLAVFDLSIGQTFDAVFVAKDSSGNLVSGVSLTSTYPSCVVTTDSNGQATVTLTGASMAGSDMGKIYVTSDSSKFLDFRIVTGGTTPPPTPQPTGEVATIEAVNASSFEGTLPVFNATIGQTLSATFVAKDSSGNVVSGASLSVLYPNEVLVTDSSGQVTVTIPASSFEGWDSDKIWVTDDANTFLEFKIIYS